MKLYNISYLCNYFTSSISSWEEYQSGSLLDGSNSNQRFSIHTLEEEDPFVQVNLEIPCYVAQIEVIIRTVHLNKIIPLDLYVKLEEDWIHIGNMQETKFFEINQTISSLRVAKKGKGIVAISAINILTDIISFNSWLQHKYDSNLDTLVYTHCPFYGLGGRLSVIATALGFLGNQNIIKEIALDPKSAKVLDYPKCLDTSKDGKHYHILQANLAKHFVDHIFEQKSYNSEKKINLFDSTELPRFQKRKVVFISRDNVAAYTNKNEDYIDTCRRLYKRIIPNELIRNKLTELENKFNLNNLYHESLGVHVRHGNGEKYYSPLNNTWGVKPPSADKIFKAIKKPLDDNPNIKNIILSSDCNAVSNFIKEQFPTKNIIYLSQFVQDIGMGCNHTNSLFNQEFSSLKKTISLELEDQIVFTEILALSKCYALCGGKSFFFNTVKGFSECDPTKIYYLDNSDRYIKIDDNFQLVANSNNDIISTIKNKLKENKVYIDGLFYSISDNNDCISLSYFNDILYKGTIQSLLANIPLIKNKLVMLRLY